MSENNQASHVPEPEEKSSLESERSPEPEMRDRQEDNLTTKPLEPTSDVPQKKRASGSLLRRLTGSLYRITGSISESKPESAPASGTPASGETASGEPAGPTGQKEDEGLLGDLRSSISMEDEVKEAVSPLSEPVEVPPEDLRRITEELDPSLLASSGEAEDDRESLEPGAGQKIDTDSLMRRMTGPFAPTTNSLDESSPNLASEPAEPELTPRGTGELPPAPAPEGGAGQDAAEGKESPTLVRRITGSLRRVTGSLGTSPLAKAQRREEGAEGAETSGGEPPKRNTGPLALGSLLTGILRSSEAEKKETLPKPPEEPDYVSQIRQDLVSDEINQPKKAKATTNLLHRITGALRRSTGGLGQTTGQISAEPPGKAALEPDLAKEPPADLDQLDMQAEIEDVLLMDRLADTAPLEPPAWAEPEDIVIGLDQVGAAEYPIDQPLEPFNPEEVVQAPPETDKDLTGDLTDSLIALGAAAAVRDEESRKEETSSDWVAEFRHEAAEEEAESGETQEERSHKGVTASLSALFAGLIARPGGKQPEDAESDVSDELVTGRLGKSLGLEPGEEFATETALPGEGESEILDMFGVVDETGPVEDEDEALLKSLQAGLEQQAEDLEESFSPYRPLGNEIQEEDAGLYVPYEPVGTAEPENTFAISPEDEKLLWGSQPLETPSDVDSEWEALQSSFAEEEASEKPAQAENDDAYVATFLTGTDTMAPLEYGQAAPPRRVTGKLNREHTQKPFEDIRSVLLEDYQAAEQGKPRAALTGAAIATAAAEPGLPKSPSRLSTWLASRTTLQKIILVEMVLVVLALIVVLPLFGMRLSEQSRSGQLAVLSPRSLPADIPFPTRITLPGGWSFLLGKSRFVNNEWNPTRAEWLEGSELRRVVAIPWNIQTEAVVKTFVPGDVIDLKLSNNDILQYKVDEVVRISRDDNSITLDNSPSLIIILSQEDAPERWVVIAKK